MLGAICPRFSWGKNRAGFFLELLCACSLLLAFTPKNKMEKSVVFLCHLIHFLLIIVGGKKSESMAVQRYALLQTFKVIWKNLLQAYL